ncbi:putative disease resistance protein RGA3 [Dioscorea cayenensis subsp. rotundata]|uniref:Disease resistance protein RGA3 n=1 Tax=Dioscorea cayennensis subsp. rotundata TaxID=55577 RepID=A0AB40BW05_DIOCR|nr:putative disease resistance protein RGA3 [Dioscorea cayenensis subsp. rotundata]
MVHNFYLANDLLCRHSLMNFRSATLSIFVSSDASWNHSTGKAGFGFIIYTNFHSILLAGLPVVLLLSSEAELLGQSILANNEIQRPISIQSSRPEPAKALNYSQIDRLLNFLSLQNSDIHRLICIQSRSKNFNTGNYQTSTGFMVLFLQELRNKLQASLAATRSRNFNKGDYQTSSEFMAVSLQELRNKLQASLAATPLSSSIIMELEKLSLAMTSLESAKKKPNKKSNDVKSWLYELQQAAYDAYDFLQCLPLRALEENGMEKVVLQQTELIIKDIQKRLEKLMEEQPPYAAVHHHLQQSDDMNSKISSLGIPPDEVRVVGRDEDRAKMIQLLTFEESSQMELSLIAIVGRAGVGKSTLARLVYDDERVASHFPLKFWVSASEIHDNASLLRSVASSLSSYKYKFEREHNHEGWKDHLAASRFLLVLDDFCCGVIECRRLCDLFGTETRGSKIVISVEDEEIVKNMGLHYLSCYPKELCHEDSWSLFKECACLNLGTTQVSRKFEQVGRKIVKKLEGLPLAARMVGCLLCSNTDLTDWKIILNADVWKAKADDLYGIPAALWLSYKHLPSHIKRSLAYCSVFPRGHIFNREDLIHMWIAQGLIQPQEGTRMEDSGIEYFDYLVRRSFFRSIEPDNDMAPMFRKLARPDYVMHDVIHKLAVVIALGESLRISGGDKSYENVERTQRNHEIQRKKVRHLYLQSDCLALSEVLGLSMLGDIETLVFYRTNELSFDYDSLFKRLTSVRVLYLCDKELEVMPESIGELKQLRCLNLSKTSIVAVPEQVCGLFNLQTLKLDWDAPRFHVTYCEKFPEGMSKLINLRHFKARDCKIPKIGRLTCLQDLEEFIVSREEGHKIEELKYMNQITGSLALHYLDNVYTEEEAKEAALNDKEHLEDLYLSWRLPGVFQEDTIFEALKPHPNLKKLTIARNLETATPSWLEDGSLCNLESLRISQCHNFDLLLLGQLQSLKSLWVNDLSELLWLGPRCWNGGEDVLFLPCLSQLHIEECFSLTELIPLPPTLETLQLKQVGLQVLPGFQQSRSSSASSFSLTSVHISDCYRLTSLQVGLLQHQNQHQLQALTRLTISNCNQLLYLPDHGFSALNSLQFLHIERCKNLKYKRVENENANANLPSSLLELKIMECPHLTNDSFFMGLESLHSLTSLKISCGLGKQPQEVELLTSLPHQLLQQMKALTELSIIRCRGLELLGFESLVSLKTMKIIGCRKLQTECSSLVDTSPLPLEYMEIKESSLQILTEQLMSRLTFLRELKLVHYCPMASFPKSMDDGLHCLVSLQRLHFLLCHKLRALPDELASIPFLKELYIIDCKKLKCLPDKGVPLSLELLVIHGCGDLYYRCLDGGEDWPKISHAFVQAEYGSSDDSS